MTKPAGRLDAARDALAGRALQESLATLTELDAAGELDARGLQDLAEAASWSGNLDASIAALERAYGLHVVDGDRRRAAATAVDLARLYSMKAARGIGAGWLARAERLLEQEGDCPEWAGFHLRLARDLQDRGMLEQAMESAVRCQDVARNHGDRAFELLGLHQEGQLLIRCGRLEAGLRLVDEVAAAALGGELPLFWTATVFCWTISVCRDIADFERAGRLTEATFHWCERNSVTGFPGICRVHRAELMRLRGALASAEQEALSAAAELRAYTLAWAGAALREVGDIRLRQGNLAGAEEAYTEAAVLGIDPQPGRALLELARNRPAAAAAALRRTLAAATDRTRRALLRAAEVEVAIALLDSATVAEAAEELAGIAALYPQPAFQASAAVAAGAAHLVAGEADAAIASLREALELWTALDAPYEAARARDLLARSLALAGDHVAAGFEREVSATALQRLGARLPQPAQPAGRGRLSGRELEVAALVAAGLSNKEIAARLGVKLRTAEYHVEQIRNKLGFTSRVQIATWHGAPAGFGR